MVPASFCLEKFDRIMWPINPDDFETHVHAPEGQLHDDAWYFLCINGQIACIIFNHKFQWAGTVKMLG